MEAQQDLELQCFRSGSGSPAGSIYPGVDLIYYGNQDGLEYDLVVAPGIDPRMITLDYRGMESIAIDDEGNLLLHTPSGFIRQEKPSIHQRVGDPPGEIVRVAGGYVLLDSQRVGFIVGSYDMTQPLIIDPALVYSTYLGGNSFEIANGIAVDSAGMVYVVGSTDSTDFLLMNQLQLPLGNGQHVFITKIDPTKSGADGLVFSTLLGGNSSETGEGIALDGAGNMYVTGRTASSDFPREKAFQNTLSGTFDAFVTKLDPTGSTIQYSTYLGGSSFKDSGSDIAVDATGNAFVTGFTASSDFPTRNALQSRLGGTVAQCTMNGVPPPCADAFVTKIDTTRAGDASLVYSTYLGGADDENQRTESIKGSRNNNMHERG